MRANNDIAIDEGDGRACCGDAGMERYSGGGVASRQLPPGWALANSTCDLCNEGKLGEVVLTEGGHRRIRGTAVDAYVRGRSTSSGQCA